MRVETLDCLVEYILTSEESVACDVLCYLCLSVKWFMAVGRTVPVPVRDASRQQALNGTDVDVSKDG